jgi:hypothetical protein
MRYSTAQKLAAVEREIRWRMKVYPRRIESRTMTQAESDRELGVMQAIAEDYRAKLNAERPQLDLG